MTELFNYPFKEFISNYKPSIQEEISSSSFIFDKSQEGLWYNWSTSVGTKYTAISYSAGSTQILYPDLPIQSPIIKIFENQKIQENEWSQIPIYELTMPQISGIRSMLLMDNCQRNPCVWIGTFSYKTTTSYIYQWNFISNQLKCLFSFTNSNSVRTIKKYKNIVYIGTQNDFQSESPSTLYYVNLKYPYWINKTFFTYQSQSINGSIFGIYI
jgi:hypothetical protein